jgi:hypothetical protein
MFNHHFFNGEKSRQVYLDFLRQASTKQSHGKCSFVVVIDPPFGGLVEVLAFTLKQITDDYCKVNEGYISF